MLKPVHDYLEDTTQSVMKLLIQAYIRFLSAQRQKQFTQCLKFSIFYITECVVNIPGANTFEK